ncbi:MAG: ketopantoate reductase family protein [Vicinamibacteria bacterium]|nr:ketopantoate reductase family protein [Vicinamibacteria bacterium]
MKIAVLGSGAVGGYYGALLARAGHEVVFIARSAHRDAIRSHGLWVRGPLGEWQVRARAEHDTAVVGRVDLVLFAVKTYDNDTALPLLDPMVGESTIVLTMQNGVDSPEAVAAVVGRGPVVGGAAYIATALSAPGVIDQTGTYRRIAFGEVFDPAGAITPRVATLHDAFAAADIQSEPAADGRVPLWEKFIYLAPFAGMTGAARQPVGVIRSDPAARAQLVAAFAEVHALALAEGVPVAADLLDRVLTYVDGVPATMRSSLLIDLSQGKRIEVEALQGAVVRRAAIRGVPVPVMTTLYAVLRAASHQLV